jgi:hypothetical protein
LEAAANGVLLVDAFATSSVRGGMDIKKIFSPTNLIIAGVFALIMLYVAFDAVKRNYFGAKMGEPCNEASDCNGRSWCMETADKKGRYCTHDCVSQAACPATWTCGDSGFSSQLRFSNGATGVKKPVNVCYKDQAVKMAF